MLELGLGAGKHSQYAAIRVIDQILAKPEDQRTPAELDLMDRLLEREVVLWSRHSLGIGDIKCIIGANFFSCFSRWCP